MVGEMGSILRELEQVQDRLTSLTQDAQAEKLNLLNRQDLLRTRAARLAVAVDAHCSTQNLLTQLAGLRRHLVAFERQRRGAPIRSDTHGQSSPTPSMSRIEQRISRIERILADRGIDLR